jgi:hypothetical protein
MNRGLNIRLITPIIEFFIDITGTVESVLEITDTVESYRIVCSNQKSHVICCRGAKGETSCQFYTSASLIKSQDIRIGTMRPHASNPRTLQVVRYPC